MSQQFTAWCHHDHSSSSNIISLIIIIIIIIIIFFFTLGRCSRGRKKLVIKEKKNINTPMASDPGGSRQ